MFQDIDDYSYSKEVQCINNERVPTCGTYLLRYIKYVTAGIMDPLQFAYQINRSGDDAVALALHYMLEHLERPGTYVRVLFIDFSSALTLSFLSSCSTSLPC